MLQLLCNILSHRALSHWFSLFFVRSCYFSVASSLTVRNLLTHVFTVMTTEKDAHGPERPSGIGKQRTSSGTRMVQVTSSCEG